MQLGASLKQPGSCFILPPHGTMVVDLLKVFGQVF
jgi:hypothetical protein